MITRAGNKGLLQVDEQFANCFAAANSFDHWTRKKEIDGTKEKECEVTRKKCQVHMLRTMQVELNKGEGSILEY